jgi:hypothetical protein
MGLFKKLFGGNAGLEHSEYFTFKVYCDRCQEEIEGKINLNNDLSMDDEGGYLVRKVLLGSGLCFQQIEVILKFNAARQLSDRQINGGTFVE